MVPDPHPPAPAPVPTSSPRGRYLLLGAGGFIGSHLAERLLAEGGEVVGVDFHNRRVKHLLHLSGFEFHQGDVGDPSTLRSRVRDADVVVNLAALCNPPLYNTQPLDVIESNFLAALPVVRACVEESRRLVHFSTSEVYGRTIASYLPASALADADPSLFVLEEETSPLVMGPVQRQRWCYASAKQLMERVIYAEGRCRGLRYSIVRPFNFIGARMDYIPGIDGEGVPRVVACFMEAFLRGHAPRLVDGGSARRSFLHIDDAVDAIVRILDRPEVADGRIFNIGHPDVDVSMAQVATQMAAAYESVTGLPTSPPEHVSAREFYGEGYEDCDRRVPDMTFARTLLGWEPRIGLEEAIRRTVVAFVAQYGTRVRGGT
jgi:UDP-apiose/xylose synthase